MTPEKTEHWRAAFETWAATEYGNDDDDSGVSLERRGDGYAYSGVDDAWQGWKGALLSASKPAVPEGWKLVPDHANADAIVTSLYRRFKDWSKRGFGPDDVISIRQSRPMRFLLKQREIFTEIFSVSEI